jgi:molecular chaperone Hsp33
VEIVENKDILRKYLAHNNNVLVYYIDATKMVTEARKVHNLSNVATAALGRTMMITAIMAKMLKEDGNKITVQVKGDGPLGQIVVCGNYNLDIKGYVDNQDINLPLNELGKLDVKKAVGKGTINIVKDIGLKEPYIGKSELVSGEIAEDFAYYFAMSEQTPCVVSLGVNIGLENSVDKACGYVIMPLPKCDEKIIDILEQINLNISSITNLSLDIENIDDIVKTITGDNNTKCIEENIPKYICDCNEDRITKAIFALGKKESIDALENNNGILELTCNFCNKSYKYTKEDIEKLFENNR